MQATSSFLLFMMENLRSWINLHHYIYNFYPHKELRNQLNFVRNQIKSVIQNFNEQNPFFILYVLTWDINAFEFTDKHPIAIKHVGWTLNSEERLVCTNKDVDPAKDI